MQTRSVPELSASWCKRGYVKTLQPQQFGVRCPEAGGFWSLTVPLGFSSKSSSKCSRLRSPSWKAILDWKGTGNDSWERPLKLLTWTPRHPYTFCEAAWEKKVLFTILIGCENLGLWLGLHLLQLHIAFWKFDLPSQWKVSDWFLYSFNLFQVTGKKKKKNKNDEGKCRSDSATVSCHWFSALQLPYQTQEGWSPRGSSSALSCS